MVGLRINVICPICGKKFTKCKAAAIRSSLCRSCSTKETYKKNEGSLERALEKRKLTCLKKYGVDNIAKDSTIKEKEAQTHFKNYGVRRPLQRKEVYQKAAKKAHTVEAKKNRIKNSLEKYGEIHYMKNKDFLEKFQKNFLAKTGYDNPLHNPETVQKIIDKYGRIGAVKGYIYSDIHFDSSWELAYYIWLVDHKKQFVFHPNFPLEYIGDDSKPHLYFPDFLVEGKFYELKGTQFFNENDEPFNMYTKKFWWEKYKALEAANITILKKKDIDQYLIYIKNTYGKNYLQQFRAKEKASLQKPQII